MSYQVGTRLNCILGYAGEGIVYGVHGEQRPETVEAIAGIVQRGGNATFDVVFLNGSISRSVPEAVVHGVQWSRLEGLASEEQIAEALANAACVKAANASAQQVAKERYAAEVDRLKVDPAYKRLAQDEDAYSGKLAAKNIRAQLKAAFPGVKFSVTKRGYGTLNVSWTDGPKVVDVDAITDPYQSGSFDGMQDLYTSAVSPWNAVFGGAKYVFTRRDHSPAHIQAAIDDLFNTHGGLEGIEKPTPATMGLKSTAVPNEMWDLATLIRIRASELEAR